MTAQHTEARRRDCAGYNLPPVRTRTIDEAVQECFAGHVAAARKAGRNPRYPYVPIIKTPDTFVPGKLREAQIRGRAHATRDAALACAENQIDRFRKNMREKLSDPTYRVYREQWGVPDSECTDPALAAALARIDGGAK